MRPERYAPVDSAQIKDEILGIVAAGRMLRPTIYEALVPEHFMQYKTSQYRSMIDELVFKEKRLFRDPAAIRQANKMNDETLLSTIPWPGGKG